MFQTKIVGPIINKNDYTVKNCRISKGKEEAISIFLNSAFQGHLKVICFLNGNLYCLFHT